MRLFAQADALSVNPAVVVSKSLLAVSLVAVLAALQRQLDEQGRCITEVFPIAEVLLGVNSPWRRLCERGGLVCPR